MALHRVLLAYRRRLTGATGARGPSGGPSNGAV
jgi:hypothetical protein